MSTHSAASSKMTPNDPHPQYLQPCAILSQNESRLVLCDAMNGPEMTMCDF